MKNTISYENTADFYNELRVKVKDYLSSNNLRKDGSFGILAKSLFMLVLYILPYFLMVLGVATSTLGLIICWLAMGIGMAGVGMGMMHDANHGSLSKSSKLNSILSESVYLVGGFPPNWKYQHNVMHHGYTNIDGFDEDISSIGLLRFSPHQPIKKIHKFQYLYAWLFYGLMTISWITSKDFLQLSRYTKNQVILGKTRSTFKLFRNLTIGKLLYYFAFLVVPMLTINISWYWIVALFLFMHFTCGLVLSVVFQTAHVMPTSAYDKSNANGETERHWAVHQLYNTTNYAPKSRILSWFIGGLNYQVEHHLFPNISHVHYRKISHLVSETAKKYELPYYVQKNFFRAIYSHVVMLKRLGQATG